jgi:hypothetical protein
MEIVSVGWGIQSSCLYFMSSLGIIPRADHAIFADTGAEHPKTLEYLDYAIEWMKENNGIPIHVVSDRNILDDIRKSVSGSRVASIPVFTGNEGKLRRQCTGEYKIDQVKKKIREIYGLKKGQNMKPTEMWIGISTDEATRMKDSELHNIENKYPLIDEMMSRGDCIKWLAANGFEVPIKSSCVFCPFHSNSAWVEIKNNEPESWETAKEVDNIIRKPTGNIREERFLHRSLKPIDESYLGEDQTNLFENECEGYCGI